jgi:hypothetical protein
MQLRVFTQSSKSALLYIQLAIATIFTEPRQKMVCAQSKRNTGDHLQKDPYSEKENHATPVK